MPAQPQTNTQDTAQPKDTAQPNNAQPKDNAPSGQPNSTSAAAAPASAGANCPGNPNALGTSRVLAIDPADYKRIGRMQYPETLPLQDKEVVITFDDGPLPPSSNKILDILASECVKVNYFLVGEMARSFPAVVRREYEEGHTIGTHSEDHPLHFGELPINRMRMEIDAGISDVGAALGDTKYLAPFFRIPGLDRSNLLEDELAARHLIVFSSDTVADDWRHISPEQIRSLAIKRMLALGKGILLLHDIHAKTAAALPGILKDLKDNGFRIVQVVPSASYEMAMANKPKAQMIASAIPGEINLPGAVDNAAAKPSWPQPIAPASEKDDTGALSALPAPDASAFQPESGVSDDSGNVQWPEQPAKSEAKSEAKSDTKAAAASDEGSHSGEKDSEKSAAHSRRHKHDTDSTEHEGRHHRHERAHGGGDGHHADLVSKIKALAGMFTPAH